MIEGIEAFYERLAQAVHDSLPEEWSAALYEATFFPDGSVYEAEYTRKLDGKARGFLPSSGGARTFRQLRKAFEDAGKPLWGKARFELWPDGTFKLHFDYENCDANGDALFDEDKEVERSEARHKRLTQI